MKKDRMKIVIWAVIALAIGIIVGVFLIGPAVTGYANNIKSSELKPHEDSTIYEITPGSDIVPGGIPPGGTKVDALRPNIEGAE